MKKLAAAFTIMLAGFGGAAARAAEPLPDFAAALPKADLAAGARIVAQCEQCHDLSNARSNRFGPPLWNVVGRPRASAPGFQYSAAMKADHAPWTYERLYAYLKMPRQIVPGTPMTFAGIRSVRSRIDVIAYLRSLSDNPQPFPNPAKTAPGK